MMFMAHLTSLISRVSMTVTVLLEVPGPCSIHAGSVLPMSWSSTVGTAPAGSLIADRCLVETHARCCSDGSGMARDAGATDESESTRGHRDLSGL
jgi:hypothetical protein